MALNKSPKQERQRKAIQMAAHLKMLGFYLPAITDYHDVKSEMANSGDHIYDLARKHFSDKEIKDAFEQMIDEFDPEPMRNLLDQALRLKLTERLRQRGLLDIETPIAPSSQEG